MTDYQKLIAWILRITVSTLAIIVISVVLVLLGAFFVPSINNDDIFAIIGPAFNTVIGAFVGLLGGLSINTGAERALPYKEQVEEQVEEITTDQI